MTSDRRSISRQLEQISNASLIEEGGHSKLVRRSILFIAAMLLILIVWSALTQIDEIAVSFGEVQPVSDTQTVQHVQGGTVIAVFVKNGEEVQAGDQLIKFDPESVRAELQKSQSKEISLLLDSVRLRAFIDAIPLTDINWKKEIEKLPYNTPENYKNIAKSIKENIALLEQQNNERSNQYKIYREKITQKKAQLHQYFDSKLDLEKKLALHKEEENMYQPLTKQGYVSQRDYIIAQRTTLEAVAQLKQIDAKIDEFNSGIQEAEEELKKVGSTFNKEALELLNQINSQLLEIHHTIQRLTELNKNLVIKAPITGIVKGLTVLPGSVITPGESIFDIIPTRGEMIVDCKISTRDIGHVHLGDPAQIKIMAYEFTRYGSINGKVLEISASTFTNKDGLPYYKAKVSLEKNYVGYDPKFNHLKPGMTAEVDIKTGQKSVISYLLKPITRGFSTAFKER